MTPKTKAWISAFRLRTLPLSFSNILLGGTIAHFFKGEGVVSKMDTSERWLVLALTLATTLFLQILSNLANDYGDSVSGADNEGRIGPMRAVQSGVITSKEMLRAIILFSILSLISGILLLLFSFNFNVDWVFFSFIALGLAAIAAAIKYTVGRRAYGYSGLGDLFVFIFFGLVGVMGTYYLMTHEFNPLLILPATTMGCFSVAVLNLNNMRDQINDKAVGKNTLVVKLGFKKSKVYHFILFIVAYLAFPVPYLIITQFHGYFIITLLPVFIIHTLHLIKVSKITDPKDFDPELKKVALSAFLFSLLFFLVIVVFR